MNWFKRKQEHKLTWTIEWRDDVTWQLIAPQSVVKIEQRPSFQCNSSTVISNSTGGHYWVPGIQSWEEMKVTYRDVEDDEGGALFLHWISKQYSEESKNWQSLEKSTALLRLHIDEKLFEVWQLEGCFITSLDLDFGYDDIYQLNVSFRFSSADYSSHPFT